MNEAQKARAGRRSLERFVRNQAINPPSDPSGRITASMMTASTGELGDVAQAIGMILTAAWSATVLWPIYTATGWSLGVRAAVLGGAALVTTAVSVKFAGGLEAALQPGTRVLVFGPALAYASLFQYEMIFSYLGITQAAAQGAAAVAAGVQNASYAASMGWASLPWMPPMGFGLW